MKALSAGKCSATAPGPFAIPLLGSVLEFRGNRFATMLDWHRRYGDVVRFRLGPRLFHMISHPALAEEVLITRQDRFIKMHDPEKPVGIGRVFGQGLVTSRGELWKRQRRLIQPLFHRSRVASYADSIIAAGRSLGARWRAFDPSQPVDVAHEVMRTTLEIITRTMFSTSVLDRIEAISRAFGIVLRHAAEDLRNPLMPPAWLPTPGNRAFRDAIGVLDEVVYGLIRERRASGMRQGDLLDQLLEARDEETGLAMDDRQIRDEVLTIFVAGHETTAVALSWAWFLLASHPDARDRMHDELGTALGGRDPNPDDLPPLTWTRAVFEESLRLYPPALGVVREVVGDQHLGGWRLPAKSLVFVNIANIQRHPEFWDDPAAFRPGRFLDSAAPPGHRLAYMPFGAGPRVCLGNHFALAEGVLLLALIARDYRLDLLPGQKVEPEIVLTLRPKGGLKMRIYRREPG